MPKKKNVTEQPEQKSGRKRSKSYSRNKGARYEQQIAKELRELGYPNVKTSRNESKTTDDNKIDIIDPDNRLPINIQLKKTQNIPAYFKIRSESDSDPEKFCIIWARQEKKATNICTVGECAIISKQMLYKLLKCYEEHNN